MKKLLLVLIIILGGCSPYSRVSKYWDKIQKEVRLHPELVDSLKLVRHDTIKSVVFMDRVISENDAGSWSFEEFSKVDSAAVQEVKAKGSEKIIKAKRLQDIICPDLTRDSTYHLKLYNKRVTLYVPIHLSVFAKGGKLEIRIMSDSVQMPDPSIITQVEIRSPVRHFYTDQWFWTALVLLILLTLVLVQLARRL